MPPKPPKPATPAGRQPPNPDTKVSKKDYSLHRGRDETGINDK